MSPAVAEYVARAGEHLVAINDAKGKRTAAAYRRIASAGRAAADAADRLADALDAEERARGAS